MVVSSSIRATLARIFTPLIEDLMYSDGMKTAFWSWNQAVSSHLPPSCDKTTGTLLVSHQNTTDQWMKQIRGKTTNKFRAERTVLLEEIMNEWILFQLHCMKKPPQIISYKRRQSRTVKGGGWSSRLIILILTLHVSNTNKPLRLELEESLNTNRKTVVHHSLLFQCLSCEWTYRSMTCWFSVSS